MEQKNKQILELSNNLLSRYKKNAGASASAADASGDIAKGNKRFSGIMKATRKQFSNDAKKSVAEGFSKLTPQQKAHEYNLDSAQREMDRRHHQGEDMTGAKIDKKTYKIIKPKKQGMAEAKDPREYDYEGDMAKSQLRSIIANAQSVHDMLEDTTNIAEWVQSKITLSADYISTVADYMQSEVNEKAEQGVAEGIKSKIAGIALSALAAHGAAHGRVTGDGQGGYTGGYKPTATATASTPSDNKPAAASPSGFSKEYLQQAADPNRFGRHMISVEKAAELLKNMKEETVLETKGAPKGFHFTKDGKLKRGDADQDGNGGPMLRTDPLDKQRNKVPAVSEGTNNTFKSFRNQLAEKHLTPAEMKKREEVAKAMEREQPGMPMGKKMAIATATAKKAA